MIEEPEEYVDVEYRVVLSVRETERPPDVSEIQRAVYQGVSCNLDGLSAVDVRTVEPELFD